MELRSMLHAAGLAVFALGAMGLVGCGGTGSTGDGPVVEYAYIASGGDVKQYQILVNGTLSPLAPASATSPGAWSVVTTPNAKYAYAGNSNGAITQYKIEVDGRLTPLSPVSVTTDTFPDQLLVTPDSKFLYAACSTTDKVAQYSIGVNGTLTPLSPAQVDMSAEGVYRSAITPDGKFFFAGGPSGTACYSIGLDGKLSSSHAAVGSASSWVSVSTNAAFLYSATGGSVEQFSIAANGALTPLSPASVVCTAGGVDAIGLTPNGNFAYVGNFNGGFPNSPVDQFSVGVDGKLVHLNPDHVTCGNAPVQIVTEPTGSFAYIMNVNDGTTSVFNIGGDGKLTPNATPVLNTGGAHWIAIVAK